MSEHDRTPTPEDDDDPSLSAAETDHLKTEAGSEKVIAAQESDPTEAGDRTSTQRYRRDPSGLEPRSLGRHARDEVDR